MKRLMALLVLLMPLLASAQDFEQGPGAVGVQRALVGKVIGLQGDCALVLADTQRPGWEGLGGGGRFFYCAPRMEMGKQLEVVGIQQGTRRARVGPRWRTLAVYYPVASSPEQVGAPKHDEGHGYPPAWPFFVA